MLAAVVLPMGLHASESPNATIDQIYGAQIAKVRATPSTADDLALAQNMSKDAARMASDPALETALLQRALDLAMADANGGDLAQQIVGTLVQGKVMQPEDAWKALVTKGQDALRQRNLGAADGMLHSYFEWKLQLVRVAVDAHDFNTATQQLGQIRYEAQVQKMKYLADLARLLAARVQMEKPYDSAASEAVRKVAGLGGKPSQDPKLNLAAGEAVLAQTGDWREAIPYLVRSNDPRWILILNMRLQAKMPDGSPADEILPVLPAAIF
ncbi:MAG: hypothetical protein ACREJ2_00380, partial [Planctomycetota bacterium]